MLVHSWLLVRVTKQSRSGMLALVFVSSLWYVKLYLCYEHNFKMKSNNNSGSILEISCFSAGIRH